jgi:hypothetical protein
MVIYVYYNITYERMVSMSFLTKVRKSTVGLITFMFLSVLVLSPATASAATYLQVYPQGYPETTIKLTSEAATRNIFFNVDDAWTATTDVSWISLNKTSGTGTDYITATIAQNQSGVKRYGNVTITAGTLSHSVPVEQDAVATYLTIGYYETSTCSAWGANLYVGVNTNTYWYVTADANFVSFSNVSSGYGNATCEVLVAKNTSGSTRTVHLTFHAGTITKIITIIQPSV